MVNISQVQPALRQHMLAFDAECERAALAAGIAKAFYHLLKLRASQVNGCAYCCRMHAADALSAGERADRLAVLPAWRDCGYFNPAERAGLALVEAVTRISEPEPLARAQQAAQDTLSEQEIAAIAWIGVVINAWNRIAIASHTPVNP